MQQRIRRGTECILFFSLKTVQILFGKILIATQRSFYANFNQTFHVLDKTPGITSDFSTKS